MVATYDSEGLKSLDKILIAITNCGGIGREVTGESEYHPFLGTRDPNVKYMLFKPKPSCHTSMRMVKEGDAWKFDQEE